MSQRFAGSSFTQSNPGYSYTAQQWQRTNLPAYDFAFSNQAAGGDNTWSNLVRLVTGDDLFIIDHANDSLEFHFASMEALIRRLWAANQNTRIIMVSSPTWLTKDTGDNGQVNTPYNATVLADMEALADHYGVAWIDYWAWCRSVVPDTYDLTDLTADTVHPTAIGYAAMAALLEVELPTGGSAKPATLPARLYDSADYENTPVRVNGTANDGTTGTWSTTGTRIESSTAGSTVTFAATCQSFGIYRSDGGSSSGIEYSVNGGADWLDMVSYQNGTVIPGGRAAYSIIIRVKAGGTVRIDEFWAI